MSALTLTLGDASNAWGSSHGQLQNGGLVLAVARRSTGWTPGTKASGQMSPMVWGSKQATGTFTSTAVPPAAPTTTNCLRSINSFRGSFAAAGWTFSFALRSNTAAYTGRCRMRFRVFRSANQDGSSATELTSSTIVGNATTANLATGSSQVITASWTPGSTITLSDEYLFVEVGLEVTSAGGGSTQDALLVTDPSNSFVTTSTFTADATAFVKGFSSSFAAAPNGKDYVFGAIRNIADEPTLRVFQKDLQGASDLFALFWAGDTSNASRWYIAASSDGGLTWTNYAASNAEPNLDTLYNNYGCAVCQTTDGKVHWLSWNGNDANLWYNRAALTRDGSGHITGWSWEAERQTSITPVLAGSELRVHLERVQDANGVNRLLVTFMDNPHLQGSGGVFTRVCAAVTTPTAGQAPTGATSWCKLTNSSSTNAFDVLGAWSTNASTDAAAFVNFTGIGTTVPTDNHVTVHSEGVLPNRDIHVFHGGWAYQDQTLTVPSVIRRWRLTNASGSNWTNDSGVSGASMLSDDGTHRPLLTGAACVTANYVYVPLMKADGTIQIDKIDTSGTRTQNVLPGLDPTNASAGYYVALSVAADDAQAWAAFMSGIALPDYFRTAYWNGSAWSPKYDDTLERWAANPAANYGTGNQNAEWVPIYQCRDVTNGVVVGSYPNAQYIAGGTTHTNSVLTFLNPGGIAASLVGSVSGQATVTGNLTVPKPLAGDVVAGATPAGALTTGIRLASPVSSGATVSGDLTTGIRLQGGAVGSATETGDLTTQIPLAGSVTDGSAATGDLTTGIRLQGAVAGTSAAAASLTSGPQLAGAVAGQATVTGTLGTGVSLAGAISGAPSVTGDLTTGVQLQGGIAGSGASTGALSTAIKLAGDVSAVATASAALTTGVQLGGAVAGVSELSADLGTTIQLAGQPAGAATVTGALTSLGTQMDGAAAGHATVTGNLSTAIPLGAGVAGAASLQGGLSTGIPLAGQVHGSSSAAGALATAVSLDAGVQGTATVTGALTTGIALAGDVHGTGTLGVAAGLPPNAHPRATLTTAAGPRAALTMASSPAATMATP